MIALVRRAAERALARRAWLGQWTPAFALVAVATMIALFYSIAPHWYDMERYWLAWLGERAIHGDLPRAVGAESPYDTGRGWMPVEWLYAVAVAWTRERHVFAVLAIANGLAGVAILWWALGACIARRVPGTVATLVVAGCFLPAVERYELRAEAIGSALLVAVLAWGASPKKRIALIPLFAVWANVHPSFVFGLAILALQTFDGIRHRDRASVLVFCACAAATLCNPFGIALWTHVWWLSHGWIARTVPEWQPLLQAAPLYVMLLCIPLLSVLERLGMRRRPIVEWMLWPLTAILAVSSQRFVLLATGIGAPAACGLFRQRDLPVPRAAVWVVALAVAYVGARGIAGDARQLAASGTRDVDFGVLVTASSPPVVERAIDLQGKLVSCVPGWYCNAALYFGARTLYDGRTEPFSAQRVRELSASLDDPRILRQWALDYAIVPPAKAGPLEADGSWREVTRSSVMVVFRRRLPPT